MITIWNILFIVSVILLASSYNSKNAIWGGFTLGLIIGTIVSIPHAFNWMIIKQGVVIGTLLGFAAEMLPIIVKSSTKSL